MCIAVNQSMEPNVVMSQMPMSRQAKPLPLNEETPSFYRSRAERAIEFQAVSELKHLPEYIQNKATNQVEIIEYNVYIFSVYFKNNNS